MTPISVAKPYLTSGRAALTAVLLMQVVPARSDASTKTVFYCSLGAKAVSVMQDGHRLTYRFGMQHRAELSISGDGTSNTVFFRSDQYTDVERQLRFAKDDYSYIVYSMEANAGKGTNAVSGLLVLKGTHRISDSPCRPHATFEATDFNWLPNDSDAFAAMSF